LFFKCYCVFVLLDECSIKNIYLHSMESVEIKNNITTATSFVDEAFDTNRSGDYQLIIQLAAADVFIAVKDIAANKFIAFEHITIQKANFFQELDKLWETVLSKSKLLHSVYQLVSCVLVNNKATLVPNSVLEVDKKEKYLNFNSNLLNSETVFLNELKSIDASNLFSVEDSIKAKIKVLCSGDVVYSHFSSTLIESLVLANKNKVGKKLFVHIQSTHFEIVLLEGKKLLFYNTFTYQSPEDLAYYLLFVCEQMQLNPETIEVELLGEVVTKSAIYKLLEKYIRTLTIGKREDTFELSYQLQTLPHHFYYTLFNSYYSF
jgi:Protein of unknown function (DUF3822)